MNSEPSEPASLASPVVSVRRQPGDWRLAQYRLADVRRMRWDYIGGGMGRRSAWHVYCYVMCDGMISGKVAHSCQHGPAPHRIKVCITKKYNEKIWPTILAKVGPRPEPRSRKRRRRKARMKMIGSPNLSNESVQRKLTESSVIACTRGDGDASVGPC